MLIAPQRDIPLIIAAGFVRAMTVGFIGVCRHVERSQFGTMRWERIFVSDEHGGVDAVIDAQTDKLLTSIPLGGGAGNTV